GAPGQIPIGFEATASNPYLSAPLDLATMARFIMLCMSTARMVMPASKSRAELSEAKERGYYSIGKAAELSGITPKMIRHYESMELIPKASRTAGDYRVYSAADIHTLRFIRRARGLGFSMDEIGTLLGLW